MSAIKIKPLVWKEFSSDFKSRMFEAFSTGDFKKAMSTSTQKNLLATTPFGNYLISCPTMGRFEAATPSGDVILFTTIDKAKAACERHWQKSLASVVEVIT